MASGGMDESTEEEVPILDEFGNKIYEPYLKNDIWVYIVNDFTFHGKDGIPQQLQKVFKINPD